MSQLRTGLEPLGSLRSTVREVNGEPVVLADAVSAESGLRAIDEADASQAAESSRHGRARRGAAWLRRHGLAIVVVFPTPVGPTRATTRRRPGVAATGGAQRMSTSTMPRSRTFVAAGR